jgi:transposase
VTKPINRSYSLEFKLALVERFLAGEAPRNSRQRPAYPRLACSKRGYVRVAARARTRCVRSLQADPGSPTPAARRPRSYRSWSGCDGRTNGCGAEVAYLGKLRALRAQERR